MPQSQLGSVQKTCGPPHLVQLFKLPHEALGSHNALWCGCTANIPLCFSAVWACLSIALLACNSVSHACMSLTLKTGLLGRQRLSSHAPSLAGKRLNYYYYYACVSLPQDVTCMMTWKNQNPAVIQWTHVCGGAEPPLSPPTPPPYQPAFRKHEWSACLGLVWQLTINQSDVLIRLHLVVHAGDLILWGNAGQSQSLDAQPTQPQCLHTHAGQLGCSLLSRPTC